MVLEADQVDWTSAAACLHQTDKMFPAKGDWMAVIVAKNICRGCPVQQECL